MSTPAKTAARELQPGRISISIALDMENHSIVIELPAGRDGFALREPDMRDLAARIVSACDELHARRRLWLN